MNDSNTSTKLNTSKDSKKKNMKGTKGSWNWSPFSDFPAYVNQLPYLMQSQRVSVSVDGAAADGNRVPCAALQVVAVVAAVKHIGPNAVW